MSNSHLVCILILTAPGLKKKHKNLYFLALLKSIQYGKNRRFYWTSHSSFWAIIKYFSTHRAAPLQATTIKNIQKSTKKETFSSSVVVTGVKTGIPPIFTVHLMRDRFIDIKGL